MIEDFKITDDPSKISVYAGMVTSAFTLAEFATGVMWGRLSDKIGRKPVLLFGLVGTAISVLTFGFAPNLPVALFARALGGLLNGNIGVLQTTVAELVTVKEQQRMYPRPHDVDDELTTSSTGIYHHAHGMVHWVSFSESAR